MEKEFLVQAWFDGPFPEKAESSVPVEEVVGKIKFPLSAAMEYVSQKSEARLKELGLWGKRYVFFIVAGAAAKEWKDILAALGWKEVIFYENRKEDPHNGWKNFSHRNG